MTTAWCGLTAVPRVESIFGSTTDGRGRTPRLPAGDRERVSARTGIISMLAFIMSLTLVLAVPGANCAAADEDAPKRADDDTKKEPAPQSRMTIRATAADGGETLADVEFEFHGRINNGPVRLNLTSDENGLSEFPWPKGGKVESLWMTARRSGYVPVHYTWRGGTQAVELPEELALKFEAGREIGGIVQNDTGKPLTGARVRLTMPVTWPRLENYVFYAAELTTDDEGRWSWDGAPGDLTRLSMSASHVDYLDGHDRVQEGLKNKVVLNQGLKIEGRVADHDGKPLVGVAVRAGFDRFGTNEPTTTTDADGKFVLTKCKAGRSLVTVQGTGFAPQFKEVAVSERIEPLKFVLGPGHTVRIRVVDAEGKPIPGTIMVPDTWRGHRSLELRLTADAEGMASWDSAPDDAILWDILKQGYMSIRRKSLAPSDEVHLVSLSAPLVISGKVTDAGTGKAIEKFTISEGYLFENSSEPHWSGDQAHEFTKGEYTVRYGEPMAGRVLKVRVDGYRPAISRTFKSDEGSPTFDFQLEPGTGSSPSGIVLLPDGQPAAGAEVGLATRARRAMIQEGRFQARQNRVEVVRTDESGRFQFSEQDDQEFLLIALHDAGFAEVLAADFEKSKQMQLSPWGQLEGRVLLGNQPDADREISFYSTSSNRQNYVYHSGHTTKSDVDGRFRFDRVVPGEGTVSRSIVIEHGRGSTHHHGWNTPVEVKPNATTTVQIGGTGRPVAGRVRLNEKTDTPIDWATNDIAQIQPVVRDRRGRSGRGGRYIGALLKSGRFRIPDVPPGEYEIVIPVNGPLVGDRIGERSIIGRARQAFTVPEIPGGRSNAPLDLGDIEAHLFETLDPGEIAPDFTARLLEGETTRLRDHHRKVVLLDFWTSSSPQTIAELPSRRKLHERFSDNPRFYFLGLSCDYNDSLARNFVMKEAPRWPQSHVGAIQAHIPTLYTVRAVPANYLIGPSGKVLAKNLQPADLEKAVADALADEALFRAAGEPPARFPITTFEAAAKETAAPAGIAALILGDTDPGFERNLPQDDHLRAITAKGDVVWEVGGLRTGETTAASHVLAADPGRNRIYLVENLGQHLSAFNGAGERLWRGDMIPANSVAVDEATGNVWASLNSGEEAATVAFDGLGREMASMPLAGMDIACAPRATAFWIVGDKFQKVDTSQKTLFSKPLNGGFGVSVAVNPRDGSVWIAERDYSNRQEPRNRLWLLSPEGKVRRELQVDGSPLYAVACHPETGDAWFCSYESGLRRVGVEGPISEVLVENAHQVAISPTTGEIWVGTEESVLRVDSKGNEIARSSFKRSCRILGLLVY